MTSRGGPPRRLVFVNRFYHPDLSATAQMLGGVAEGLVRAGYSVTVLTSRQRYEDPRAGLAAHAGHQGVAIHRIWSTRFGRGGLLGRAFDYLSFYLSAAFALATTLRKGDIVVAKTDPPLLSLVCVPAARLRGAHVVNWLQDVFPEVAGALGAGLPHWAMKPLAWLRDASCRGAVANVVLGVRMREFFIARGVAPDRLTVIANWADDAQIRPAPTEASALRAQLGWSGQFVLAYCGNLGRAHDHETLLGAAELLRGDTNIRFLMVGGGAAFVRLEAQVRSRGLSAFHFLPYQPAAALSDTLAAADVHLVCLKPELEGLIVPSKLYGILAAGRPALFWGDPRGEVALELERTGAGVSVAGGDAQGLASRVRELRQRPAERLAMGERARKAFVERYTVAEATRRWATLLAQIQVPRP